MADPNPQLTWRMHWFLDRSSGDKTYTSGRPPGFNGSPVIFQYFPASDIGPLSAADADSRQTLLAMMIALGWREAPMHSATAASGIVHLIREAREPGDSYWEFGAARAECVVEVQGNDSFLPDRASAFAGTGIRCSAELDLANRDRRLLPALLALGWRPSERTAVLVTGAVRWKLELSWLP